MTKQTIVQLTAVSVLFSFLASPLFASTIVGVSIPIGSDDTQSHPLNDGVWEVSAPPFPFESSSGIGYLINPVYPTVPTAVVQSDFSRHDHVYSSPRIPDPTRAVVTYRFSSSTVVDQLEIIQHQNGITQIEGFVGDSLGSLTSIGSIFGTSGDVTAANALTEASSDVFDFNNTMSGEYFQFIVRKTNETDGWATYRAFPRLADDTRIPAAVPEPASCLMWTVVMAVLVYRRRR